MLLPACNTLLPLAATAVPHSACAADGAHAPATQGAVLVFAQCLCSPAEPDVDTLQEAQQHEQPPTAPVQSSEELQQSHPGVGGGGGGWSGQEQAAGLQHPMPALIIHRPPNAPHAAPRESDRADKPKTRTARRGPMDEMRQLVRILVKVGLQGRGMH